MAWTVAILSISATMVVVVLQSHATVVSSSSSAVDAAARAAMSAEVRTRNPLRTWCGVNGERRALVVTRPLRVRPPESFSCASDSATQSACTSAPYASVPSECRAADAEAPRLRWPTARSPLARPELPSSSSVRSLSVRARCGGRGSHSWKRRGPSAVDSTPPGAVPKYPDPGQQGNDLSRSRGD